jgi:hypothetical protein
MFEADDSSRCSDGIFRNKYQNYEENNIGIVWCECGTLEIIGAKMKTLSGVGA